MLIIFMGLISMIVMLIKVLRKNEHKRFYQLLEQFPSHPTYPLIGNTNMLLGSEDGLLEKFENIMQSDRILFWLGPIPCLLLKKYDDIATVLSQSQDRDSLGVIQNWLGIGLMSARYDKWKTSRRILNQAFTPKMFSKYKHAWKRQASDFVEKLKSFADSGCEVDISDLVMNLNLTCLVENTIGISIQSGGKLVQDFCDAAIGVICILIKCIQFPLLLISPYILWFYLKITGNIKHTNKIRVLPSKMINKLNKFQDSDRENNSEAVYDESLSKSVIDLLVKRSNNESDFTKERITDEMVQLIMTGVETLGLGVGFLALMLAINQDIQQKVYEEIAQFSERGHTTIEDHVDDLKYLEQCILETARMFNPVLLSSRRIHNDVLLKDNKIIPANLLVIPMFYFANQDSDLYKNPQKWDPEHFSEEAVKQRPKNSHISFGYGQRNCIGAKYAIMLLKIEIAYILKSYHLSTSIKEVTKRDLKADLLIRSRIGFPIKFTKRIKIS